MTFNAKARFIAKKDLANQWTEFTDTDSFAEGVQAALVVMETQLRTAQTMEQSAQNSFRMEGAIQFIGIMAALTNPAPQAKKPLATANLDHNA